MSLEQKLEKIRSNPKLENQKQVYLYAFIQAFSRSLLQTQVVLSAVEDTLRDQKSEFTPTAYFAALLSLLVQFIQPGKGIVNKEVATAVVYLLDLVTPNVPPPLLRSKFSHILKNLATALTQPDAEAPILRASIGCLESLLIAQDAQAWALSQAEISPRRAVAGLLPLAVDHRPKVRKRAQEAISHVLQNPPPSPSLDHPAADLCAESALMTLKAVVEASKKTKKHSAKEHHSHAPNSLHALQLVKTIATASGGWPSRKIDSLCEVLLGISRSTNEYLAMAAFEVFEVMFTGMIDEVSSAKIPRVLEVILDLQPSPNDSQLLPPWLAVVSRGYDVSSQVNSEETFQSLPNIFSKVSQFLVSTSHNIRISASECLISFIVNCIPASVVIDPSIYDEKILEKLANIVTELLSVKYQSAWMEVFNVVGAMLDNLRWRATPILDDSVKIIGDMRTNEAFAGKMEADTVLSKAIRAMGPNVVLRLLPLNLGIKTNEPGRAWLLPLLRDAVSNTHLAHFKSELVPLSEKMFQRVADHGKAEKTMEIKIFETVVHQIWAILPGYCDLPLDLTSTFDQQFAELISNLLYQQVELRTDLCHSLQNLVDSNKALLTLTGQEAELRQSRVPTDEAQRNLDYLATFAGNLLAILFNVYTQTLPQYRGPILQCINAYLSITPEKELGETFTRVVSMLESSFTETNGSAKSDRSPKQVSNSQMPPMSQTLMDIVITMSAYLPRSAFGQLFKIASAILQKQDANLQKKAYKLIPRLAESEAGKAALYDRNEELQTLLLGCVENVAPAAKRDRLSAIAQIVQTLPSGDLHFIPSTLPEVVISTKENNEKARRTAFDLLVTMGEKMHGGGTIMNSRVPHMPADSPNASASLDEYFTMVSAGLAGNSPHSISAFITALTRILHEFHKQVSDQTIIDLLETMDIFLKSPNRELVRSTMGFVKACVISLPDKMMLPRLSGLIPNLLLYQHEHKGQLQAKVKHILERMMRKYGYEAVEKATPEQDRKLIVNIRKTRERNKRKKKGISAAGADGDSGQERSVSPEVSRKKGVFGSEFDRAVYGSDEEEASESGSDVSDDEALGRGRWKTDKRKLDASGETYILEDEDDPLDLLDRKALRKISTTKPVKIAAVPKQKRKAKMDSDGKLIFDDEDMDMLDTQQNVSDGTLEGGINAYVAAIKGGDVARRGQKGKLKFSNKRKGNEEDEMEVDEEEVTGAMNKLQVKGKPGSGKDRPRGGAGMQKARMQRKGLGMEKTKGGRVDKSSRRKMAGRR